MGSWDCYCAICGGPVLGTTVSGEPRTAAFRERRAREVENQRQGKGGECEEDDDAEDDVDEFGSDHERRFEDHSYDQDVISEEDVAWTRTLHVLASHYDSVEETNKSVLRVGDCILSAVEADLDVSH